MDAKTNCRPERADALKLLFALQDAPDGLSRRQINRDVFARRRPAATIAAMLDSAADDGLVRLAHIKRRGQPTEVYILTP